ncbi:MAG: hypothetical protein HC781_16980, partial [Leptolyngbyaceae cyanobacterium CSU_1_4]|nr:hypothetical protein [Leptolyngbyaceae cyanobacterium CSU_1_4]
SIASLYFTHPSPPIALIHSTIPDRLSLAQPIAPGSFPSSRSPSSTSVRPVSGAS